MRQAPYKGKKAEGAPAYVRGNPGRASAKPTIRGGVQKKAKAKKKGLPW